MFPPRGVETFFLGTLTSHRICLSPSCHCCLLLLVCLLPLLPPVARLHPAAAASCCSSAYCHYCLMLFVSLLPLLPPAARLPPAAARLQSANVRHLHRQRCHTQRRRIVHPFRNAGIQFVDNIINGHPRNCLDLMCMDRNSFITLCNMLKERNLVEDGRAINVKEQVVIFLLTVGHNERNRACQYTFQPSGQTISKYVNVNVIVRALCQLGMENISRPNDETPSKIRLNPRFNPYFKGWASASPAVGLQPKPELNTKNPSPSSA
ncbi:hypothetical protein EJ110_NYTH47760 [Nymphaea thermarum]|nr:hypothetical protein EJ110_NYTH47760 [Nymphaea thermarum]